MKYLEELKPGDLLVYKDARFILTNDYKQRKNDISHYSVVNIQDGSIRWLPSDAIVENADLYVRDAEGNILLLKEFKDESDIIKNKNIS
jgi:hypothetical protein